jgi:SAM-dependent methyltransferase
MKYDKNKISNQFDKLTGPRRSDYVPNFVEALCLDSYQMLDLKAEDILLDMGSGTGTFSFKAAGICKKVIGVDLSPRRIEVSKDNAVEKNLHNVEFHNLAIEDVNLSLFPKSTGINKALFNYSLHHLPDSIKIRCLKATSEILARPGRIVIGDLMFFEAPGKFKEDFEKIGYDGGIIDSPSTVDFFCELAKELGANIKIKKYHPLSGILVLNL